MEPVPFAFCLLPFLNPHDRQSQRRTTTRGGDRIGLHHDDGHAAEAGRLRERALAWFERHRNAVHGSAWLQRAEARALGATGRWVDARRAWTMLYTADPDEPAHLGGLGIAAAHLADSLEAHRLLTLLREDGRPWRFGEPRYQAARVAAALGRTNDAIALLEDAIAEGADVRHVLHADPALAPLRRDSRFVRLGRP